MVAALALWLGAIAPARAQPPPALVLVTPPPTLTDAVTTSLSPWQIQVIVVAAPAPPAELARMHHAAHVATVRGTTLELYTTADDASQTRPVPAPMDDVAAASVALTIKTWMRLGPPPDDAAGDRTIATTPPPPPPPPPPAPPPPPPRAPRAIAVDARVGFGARADIGGGGVSARLQLLTGISTPFIDVAATAELGTDTSLDATTTAAEAHYGAHVGRRFALRRAVWVRPRLGLAAVRVRIDGVNAASGMTVTKTAYGLGIDGAFEAGWSRGPWLASVVAGATVIPGTTEIHGVLRLTVPDRVEPYGLASLGCRFR